MLQVVPLVTLVDPLLQSVPVHDAAPTEMVGTVQSAAVIAAPVTVSGTVAA